MPPKYTLYYLLFIAQQYFSFIKLPENFFCSNNTQRKIIIVTLPRTTFILQMALTWQRGILQHIASIIGKVTSPLLKSYGNSIFNELCLQFCTLLLVLQMTGRRQINTVIQRWACVKRAWCPWSGLVSSVQMMQSSQFVLNSVCLSRAVRCWHPFHSQCQHCGAVSSNGGSFLKETTVPATDVGHVYKSVEVCDTKSILT